MKKTISIISIFIALVALTPAAAGKNTKNHTAEAPNGAEVTGAIKNLLPIEVRATDMMTKIYGLVPDSASRDEAISYVLANYSLVPEEDEYGLWLDSDSGYLLSYFGVEPRVSAMAFFDPTDGSVGNYEYFFIFPYREGHRGAANRSVTEFCSNLIQEIGDLGTDPGVNVASDAVFEVVAEYDNRSIDVMLTEDTPTSDAEGRFLLTLSVVPMQNDTL